MANFTVSYLFSLRDKFSKQAAKLERVSKVARKTVHGLGGAATTTAAAAAKLGSSSSSAARGLSAMGHAAAVAQKQVASAQVSMSRMANTAMYNRGFGSMGGFEKQARQAGLDKAATILAARKMDEQLRDAYGARGAAGGNGRDGRKGKGMLSGAMRMGGVAGVTSRLTGFGPGMIATGGGLMAAKSLLSRFADFQSSEIFVKAIGKRQGHSESSLTKMAAQARQLGASTIFEPQDVLGGHLKFLQAGRSPEQAMVGIKSTLNLAATAGTSVEKASNVALNLMAQAQIPAKDLGKTMDFLTATFLNSKSELLELAQASKYALPILTRFGVPIQEQFAALGALSEGGISGTMGARGLRQIMTSMVKIPFNKKKAGLIGKWGLDLKKYFTKGKLTNFSGFIEALAVADKRSGATLIPQLFPSNAITSIQTLIAQMETFRRVRASMKGSSGINADIAKSRFKGLEGAIKQLSAAWSELGITFGESGTGKIVEAAIRGVTTSIQSLRESLGFSSLLEEMLDPGLIAARIAQIGATIQINLTNMFAGVFEAVLNKIGSLLGAGPLGQHLRQYLGIDAMLDRIREARDDVGKYAKRRTDSIRKEIKSRAPLWANQLDPRTVNQAKAPIKKTLGGGVEPQTAAGRLLKRIFGGAPLPEVPAEKLNIVTKSAKRMLNVLPPVGGAGRFSAQTFPDRSAGRFSAQTFPDRGAVPLPVQRVAVNVTAPQAIEVKYTGPITGPPNIAVGARNRGESSTASTANYNVP